MKINKKKVVSTLALIGLTLGTTVSAAEITQRSMRFHDLTSSEVAILEDAHELYQSGKDEDARKLLESSGLNFFPDHKKIKKHSVDREQHMQKFKTLIEQNDFESFQNLVAGTPMSDIINTEAKFEALVQAHELRIEGKNDEAKEILTAAGLKPFGKRIGNLK